MAHVLTFYRLPDEESRFLTYLARTGDIMACINECMRDPASEKLKPRPIRELIADEDPEDMLIGPRAFMDMAQIEEFELDGQISYGRYYADVPLISYSRGVFWEQNRLIRSNLVFEATILTFTDAAQRHSIQTPQPPEFVAWGKRVLSWVRRDAPRVVEHKRMTERVFAELSHGLELVP